MSWGRRDHAPAFVEYVTCKGILAQRTDRAILFDNDDLSSAVWIPRQALDHDSKLLIEKAPLRSEVEIAIDEKMAKEKGLL